MKFIILGLLWTEIWSILTQVAFYIGYDSGDRLWDRDEARISAVIELQKQVDVGFEQRHGIFTGTGAMGISIKLVSCDSQSMVEATNCVIGSAYIDGAEYFYRINDDSQFVT